MKKNVIKIEVDNQVILTESISNDELMVELKINDEKYWLIKYECAEEFDLNKQRTDELKGE